MTATSPHPAPVTARELCEIVGRRRLQQMLGVGRTAISNACVEGRLPAKWFQAVKGECEARGVPCPEDLFAFVQPEPLAAPSQPAE